MEQHRTIMVDGHMVHYRDEGRNNNKTLVLLHGFLQSLDVWSSYVLTYMHQIRVVTIDLPGHGHTETFSDKHSMDLMARVVKTVLDEAGVDQCVMIGHSMGGYAALAFAEKYPYTLRGLGLINSHALPDSDEHRSYRQAICDQVLENLESFGGSGRVIEDRALAIETAIREAVPGTVLVLAAKGREKYMHRGNDYVPIESDAELAERLV